MPSLYLIDAHAYLHRAYHAIPPLTTSKGEPVNAIYGFLRMISKITRQYKPDYVAVCFDTQAPTFRHVAFKAYKATRRETDTALISQFPIALEAMHALGLAVFEKDGFEADDLMAQLARDGRKKNWEVVVVSGDKDAMQLVTDHIKVLNEPKDILYDIEKVRERYGVAPERIPDVFALMGDTSDNVPGVAGIGEKTAIKLIQDYGDLESLLAAAGTIKGKVGTLLQTHADAARQSFDLVSLTKDVPLDVDWEICRLQPPDPAKLTPFLQRWEFFGLLKELAPAIPVDTSTRDYQTLTTEDALKKWMAGALKAECLAVDVETTGLDSLTTHLVGISLSYKPGSAVYIPISHRSLVPQEQISLSIVQKHLGPLLRGEHPKIYGHNLKFDALVLKKHGMPLGKLVCDTMVASYVLNPSRNSHGLKDLASESLGEPMTSIQELIGKGAKQITMDDVPVEKAAPYACADADMTLRLALKLEPLVKEKELGELFYSMEMPLVQILADMEETGIRVDKPYLKKLGEQFQNRTFALESKIHELAGEVFNINSPKQLAVILFEKLRLPIIRRTKTGISTDEEVLLKLTTHHELPRILMDYRELQKLQSTYVVGLQAALGDTGDRVHTSFNQTVAATGRLSSSDPNLQNIPIRTELGRQIRQAFIPAEGHRLVAADYSQIDLRMLAHISQDARLVEAFKNGEDIHTRTAGEIFGVSAENMTPDVRRIAKSINFGIVYGISAFGLSQQLQIPVEEAKEHIDRYFVQYAGVRNWIDLTLQEAREKGYVRTLLGRIRHLPEINSKNVQMRNFAERIAMNTPIQGTSADVIKLAMIHIAESRKRDEWSGRMLIQVHDELVFEIPENDVERSRVVLKRLMESAVSLSIPLIVDFKQGMNWSEMKPLHPEAVH